MKREKKIKRLHKYMSDGIRSKKAYKVAKKLHKMGEIEGTFILSGFYFNSFVVKNNPKKAVALLKKCVQKGYQAAKHNLALCLFSGEGIKQDIKMGTKMMDELIMSDSVKETALGVKNARYHGLIVRD